LANTNDSFIDEVTEEVRRDRLFGYFRRYGWIAVLAVVVLVGGAAYTEWRRASDEAAARQLGDGLYAAAAETDAAKRAEALSALAIAGPAAAPAEMLRAASLAEAGETAEAAAILASLAADPGQPRVWTDLAALKRVMLLGTSAPAADRIAALEPLKAPGAPYRVLAEEQEALVRLETGEREAALAMLEALLVDQEATVGLRLRVAQLMVALGSEPEGL
jgi:hypothetical protein